jgi:C-terminal processing protease CtpA/Prc
LASFEPLPLITVLVGPKTNSSGEIAAAIFKGRKNCKIMGSTTYGNLSSIETFKVGPYIVGLTTELITTCDGEFMEKEKI